MHISRITLLCIAVLCSCPDSLLVADARREPEGIQTKLVRFARQLLCALREKGRTATRGKKNVVKGLALTGMGGVAAGGWYWWLYKRAVEKRAHKREAAVREELVRKVGLTEVRRAEAREAADREAEQRSAERAAAEQAATRAEAERAQEEAARREREAAQRAEEARAAKQKKTWAEEIWEAYLEQKKAEAQGTSRTVRLGGTQN